MIHQLQLMPPLLVNTTHGEGYALVHIDYGPLENGCFLVANRKTGQFRYYDVTQVTMGSNYTYKVNENNSFGPN